ncbi:hypothetical protein Tsp_12130 [Trichinella spiralis]|uniref:hypothetical protein n=1 Tax=Trichinella spiralis TaxID=6334 RepID=UPI0001EFE155|nr:hypothetical protein Tsp_12130 [Trichinella spiralis]
MKKQTNSSQAPVFWSITSSAMYVREEMNQNYQITEHRFSSNDKPNRTATNWCSYTTFHVSVDAGKSASSCGQSVAEARVEQARGCDVVGEIRVDVEGLLVSEPDKWYWRGAGHRARRRIAATFHSGFQLHAGQIPLLPTVGTVVVDRVGCDRRVAALLLVVATALRCWLLATGGNVRFGPWSKLVAQKLTKLFRRTFTFPSTGTNGKLIIKFQLVQLKHNTTPHHTSLHRPIFDHFEKL